MKKEGLAGEDEDEQEESKEESEKELTEEEKLQLEMEEQKKLKWRVLAKRRTEDLEHLIEKLTPDAKIKESIMKPVKVTRENQVTSASENFFHFIVFDMPRDLTRHLIEKSTRKGGHKKIAEEVDREREKDRIYYDALRTSSVRRINTQ